MTAGRPRQPYCPDCRKADPTSTTRKESGSGYCTNHRKQRQMAYRWASQEDTDKTGEEVVLDYIRKQNLELLAERDRLVRRVEVLQEVNANLKAFVAGLESDNTD